MPFWWLTAVAGTAVAAPQATTRYVAPGGANGVNDCANPNNPCGGGLHNQGTLWLTNVTFTLNEALADTAVFNGGSGTITMTHVTIARNVRTFPNPPDASAVSSYGGSIMAVNTLIADNGPNQQCGGNVPLTSLGYNLDGPSPQS